MLDEPTTGLDVTTQAQILDLLRRLRAELGHGDGLRHAQPRRRRDDLRPRRRDVRRRARRGRAGARALLAPPPPVHARSDLRRAVDRGAAPQPRGRPARPAQARRAAEGLPLRAALRLRRGGVLRGAAGAAFPSARRTTWRAAASRTSSGSPPGAPRLRATSRSRRPQTMRCSTSPTSRSRTTGAAALGPVSREPAGDRPRRHVRPPIARDVLARRRVRQRQVDDRTHRRRAAGAARRTDHVRGPQPRRHRRVAVEARPSRDPARAPEPGRLAQSAAARAPDRRAAARALLRAARQGAPRRGGEGARGRAARRRVRKPLSRTSSRAASGSASRSPARSRRGRG